MSNQSPNLSAIKPQISANLAVILSPQVLMQTMAEESALLNLNTEQYFSQNETATQMFSVLTASESIEAAYTRLLDCYAVEPEQLQQDLLGFVEQLLEAELIELQYREHKEQA